jgi:hypothetical protein
VAAAWTRLIATIALVAYAAVVAGLVAYVVNDPVAILGAVVGLGIGLPFAWMALTRPRFRAVWAVVAITLIIGGLLLLLQAGRGVPYVGAILVTGAVAVGAAAVVFRAEAQAAVARRWSPAPAARHGVLLVNLRSGGGKAEKYRLVEEA